MDVLAKLKVIEKSEMDLFMVSGHAVRHFFIGAVIRRIGQDPKFDDLVERQLSMFVPGYLDPRTFWAACNDPQHLIRNRLIAWNIDHPQNSQD